jgi:hypothetical protein
MNIIQLQDALKGLSEQQLVQEMQNPSGSAPQFLVLSELKRRQDSKNQFLANQATSSTVAEDVISDSSKPFNYGAGGGIASMMAGGVGGAQPPTPEAMSAPSPVAPPQAFKDGGLVAPRDETKQWRKDQIKRWKDSGGEYDMPGVGIARSAYQWWTGLDPEAPKPNRAKKENRYAEGGCVFAPTWATDPNDSRHKWWEENISPYWPDLWKKRKLPSATDYWEGAKGIWNKADESIRQQQEDYQRGFQIPDPGSANAAGAPYGAGVQVNPTTGSGPDLEGQRGVAMRTAQPPAPEPEVVAEEHSGDQFSYDEMMKKILGTAIDSYGSRAEEERAKLSENALYQQQMAKWAALAQGGAAMASSTDPTFAGSAGAGIAAGVGAYSQGLKDYHATMAELSKESMEHYKTQEDINYKRAAIGTQVMDISQRESYNQNRLAAGVGRTGSGRGSSDKRSEVYDKAVPVAKEIFMMDPIAQEAIENKDMETYQKRWEEILDRQIDLMLNIPVGSSLAGDGEAADFDVQ